jgi:hypothetical protein
MIQGRERERERESGKQSGADSNGLIIETIWNKPESF